MRRGAEVDAIGHYLRTPISEAADGGHIEVVELLLRGGADLTPRDIERMSALDLARAAGHGAVAELLQRHGAE